MCTIQPRSLQNPSENITIYGTTSINTINTKIIKLYTLDFLARGFYEKSVFTVIATFPKTANPSSYDQYMLIKYI